MIWTTAAVIKELATVARVGSLISGEQLHEASMFRCYDVPITDVGGIEASERADEGEGGTNERGRCSFRTAYRATRWSHPFIVLKVKRVFTEVKNETNVKFPYVMIRRNLRRWWQDTRSSYHHIDPLINSGDNNNHTDLSKTW